VLHIYIYIYIYIYDISSLRVKFVLYVSVNILMTVIVNALNVRVAVYKNLQKEDFLKLDV